MVEYRLAESRVGKFRMTYVDPSMSVKPNDRVSFGEGISLGDDSIVITIKIIMCTFLVFTTFNCKVAKVKNYILLSHRRRLLISCNSLVSSYFVFFWFKARIQSGNTGWIQFFHHYIFSFKDYLIFVYGYFETYLEVIE